MTSQTVLLEEPALIPLPKSPLVRVNSQPLPTDSMISIALSDKGSDTIPEDGSDAVSNASSDVTVEPTSTSNPTRNSAEIFSGVDLETEINGGSSRENAVVDSPSEPNVEELEAAAAALEGRPRSRRPTANSVGSEGSSDDDILVDWAELEKNEESEPRNEASDEVCESSSIFLPRFLTTMIANGFLACTFGTREPGFGEESPCDRIKESRIKKRASTVYTSLEKACGGSYRGFLTVLFASSASSHDRARLLGGLGERLSTDSAKITYTHGKQNQRRCSPSLTRRRLDKHGWGQGS